MLYVLNYVTAIYVLAAILPAFFLLRYVYRHDTIEKRTARPAGPHAGRRRAGHLRRADSGDGGRKYTRRLFPLSHPALLHHSRLCRCGLCGRGGQAVLPEKFSWRNPNFNYLFDAVVYAVFVSLGFAAFENIKYVFTYGLSVALTRAVTAVPGHLSFSVFMGIFYGGPSCAPSMATKRARRRIWR